MEMENQDESSAPGGEEIDSENRYLTILESVPCGSAPGPINYFTLDFQLTPQGGFDTSGCTATKQAELGNALNAFLLDYGIGRAGVGDNAAFLAKVCNRPTTMTRRALAVNVRSFLYVGGGVCRFCASDNFDKRSRDLQDSNWFSGIYKPELENKLRNNFNEIAKQHTACLGNGPRIDPIITQISSNPSIPC